MVKTKVCRECDKRKTLNEFHVCSKKRLGRHDECKICRNKQAKDYRKREAKSIKKKLRTHQLKTRYGITPEEYLCILEKQDYRCVICGTPASKNRHGKPFIDHCHDTNKVRGLLCLLCNSGLGKFKDSVDFLKNAVKYLRKHK